MDETQQRTIAEGLRDGRPQAWRDFYDAFAERVWRAVARLVGPNAADVADVVQQTFFAAALCAREYDPQRGSLWVWVWGIARNHVALHFRNRRRHERIQVAAMNGRLQRWLDGSDAVPVDPLEAGELTESVRATLAGLDPDYGALLTARYLEDVPVEQLAREEGCTEVALRSRLARARAAFKDEFLRLGAGHEQPTG